MNLPTDADHATSALMNGLESGLPLAEIAAAYLSEDDGRSFDARISDMIAEKEAAQ